MAEGKQIRLFLIDGTFSGLVTAEIMNWTGHVFKGSRSELGRIYQREEAQRTGVISCLVTKVMEVHWLILVKATILQVAKTACGQEIILV